MTKESIYELQLIDCNCNDCGYLVRDIDAYKKAVELDDANQLWCFRRMKARRIRNARIKIKKDPIKGELALKEAVALKYTYKPQKVHTNYGNCQKFNKPVTFIPNTLSLETQDCFIHRKLK